MTRAEYKKKNNAEWRKRNPDYMRKYGRMYYAMSHKTSTKTDMNETKLIDAYLLKKNDVIQVPKNPALGKFKFVGFHSVSGNVVAKMENGMSVTFGESHRQFLKLIN